MLGYAAFLPYAGQGYLSEGVALAVRYAFERLELHRVEADIQPGNDASVRLVERLGFRREGSLPGSSRSTGNGGITSGGRSRRASIAFIDLAN